MRLLLLSLLLVPTFASAHGAMEKVIVGSSYVLNLTSAPLSPVAGKEQQNLLAVSDIKTGALIAKDLRFTLKVEKDGTETYTAQNLVATGGILSFVYTYPEAGMYELFATFQVPGDPKTYEPEDYMIQVQPLPPSPAVWPVVVAGIVGLMVGMILGRVRR